MSVTAEKKFAVEISYNGITKSLRVEPEESVMAVLQGAIREFGMTQNPHLLSFFRQDGSGVPETGSVEAAGLRPCELLLLRPNAVKGGGSLLRLSAEIVSKTFLALRTCGRGECECAVYWTGPATSEFVDGIVHPLHSRSLFGYEINNQWLTRLWKDLATTQRSIKAQIHSHPSEAFHSRTDDQWPIVSQAGFLSIVIPEFAMGEPTLMDAWIGQMQSDGSWLQLHSYQDAVILS